MTRQELVMTAVDVGLLGVIVVAVLHAGSRMAVTALPAIKTDTSTETVVAQQFVNSPNQVMF